MNILADTAVTPLPQWDTFEAFFFLFSGLFVGIVLGFLFPSVWRTFRRGFGKTAKYGSPLKEKPLRDPHAPYDVAEAFVMGRYYSGNRQTPLAIQMYSYILTHEAVSKQDTRRALFELAQIYFSNGLHQRSLEAALEAQNRKPTWKESFLLLLDISKNLPQPDTLLQVLDLYQGSVDLPLRRQIAHALCAFGEQIFLQQDRKASMALARRALSWDRASARALVLLWETTSEELWSKDEEQKAAASFWIALAADLEACLKILGENRVSPAACAPHIGKALVHLCSLPDVKDAYDTIVQEFQRLLALEKRSSAAVEKYQQVMVYALVHNAQHLYKIDELHDVITLFAKREWLSALEKAKDPLFFAHRCEKCQAVLARFLWQCPHCSARESFVPLVRSE